MVAQEKPPTNFADCYVLSSARTYEFVLSFLEYFLPDRQEYTTVYQVPELADDPTELFDSDIELIDYLVQHPTEAHAIYWANNKEGSLRGAMCLFLDDAHIIFGLVTETLFPDTSFEEKLLQQLQRFCNSSLGLIFYEEPAPRTTKTFIDRIGSSK